MSENPKEEGTKEAPTAPVRIRSRFPKAQPNIAISSGIARIRRLSGHYPSANAPSTNQDESLINECKTPPHTSSHLAVNSPLSRQTTQFIDHVLSPKINALNESYGSILTVASSPSPSSPLIHQAKSLKSSSVANSPLVINDENSNQSITKVTTVSVATPAPATPPTHHAITFRQFISQSNSPLNHLHAHVPMSPMIQQPHTPIHLFNAYTPGGSLYNPQFSKEHIMNIIKHKALQKLKKIESENLRERRKKYKKDSLASAAQMEHLVSDESNSTSGSGGAGSVNGSVSAGVSGGIDRSKLRMRDLLYYSSRGSQKKSTATQNPDEIIVEVLPTTEQNGKTSSAETQKEPAKTITPTQSQIQAAPQLKFAEDGSIVINEESLLIQRPQIEPIYDSTVVESEQNDNLNYNSYRKFHHTKKWTQKETVKFYKALSMIGTDFTMIQRLFTHRNRDEIKRKFKREEKLNQALIDKILSRTAEIDLSVFVSASSDDESPNRNGSNGEDGANSNTNGKKKKQQKDKQKSGAQDPNNPAGDENKKKNERKKLKRIKKREFVESESEKEDNDEQNKNRKNKKTIKKSKKFIIDSEDDSKDSQKAAPNTNDYIIETIQAQTSNSSSSDNTNSTSNTLPSISTLITGHNVKELDDKIEAEEEDDVEYVVVLNQTENEDENNEEEEEDEDGIELVFDMDNNSIKEIKENITTNTSIYTITDEKDVGVASNKVKTEDEEENVIFDLDNNTVIKNNNVIVLDSGGEVKPSPSKSKIVITRLNKPDSDK